LPAPMLLQNRQMPSPPSAPSVSTSSSFLGLPKPIPLRTARTPPGSVSSSYMHPASIQLSDVLIPPPFQAASSRSATPSQNLIGGPIR
jgi:hypothetical protein